VHLVWNKHASSANGIEQEGVARGDRIMQRLIGFLCLIVCLFMTVSTAVAQEPLPDLTPIVVDANQGSLEVRNIGNEAAKPSQLYVVCSMFHAGQRSTPCAAGLHLPGYIAKWNALPFDIPALKPGESYHIQLFGAGAFQKKTENVYGMQITTDPLKRIAESNEANNYTRLDVAPKPGVLRLVGQDDLPELPVYYLIRRHGKSAGKSQPIRGTRSIKALPLDFYLGPGSYDVRVVQQRSIYSTGDLDKMVIGEWLLVNSSGVLVGSKEIVELKLIFRQEPPGKLKLHLLADGHPTGAWTGIATLEGDKIQPKLMRRNLEADTELNLLPGRYEVLATPKDEGPYSRKHGYGTQQVSFEIRSGQTTDKTLRFVSARKGKLVLSALVEWRPQ